MKKVKKPGNKAGVWIDQETAIVVHIVENSDPIIEKIKSGVESRVRYVGETKVFARFGNAFISDQEKKQHRQKNQREKYFKKIITFLQQADSIYVFGPSDARQELINDIGNDPVLKHKFIKTERADRMSEKQVVQQILDYFSGESYRTEIKKRKKMAASH